MRELGRAYKYKDLKYFKYTDMLKARANTFPQLNDNEYLVGLADVGASVEWENKIFLCRTVDDINELLAMAKKISFLMIEISWYRLPHNYLIEGLPLEKIAEKSEQEWLPMLKQANKTMGFLFKNTCHDKPSFFRPAVKSEVLETRELLVKNFHIGQVLSIATGIFCCREYDELISIVVHMANQNSVFIGEERGLAIKLKPYILEQYPELKNIDQPKVNKATYAIWLKEQIAKYGETLPASEGLPLEKIAEKSEQEWLPMLKQANKTMGFLFKNTCHDKPSFFRPAVKSEVLETRELLVKNFHIGQVLSIATGIFCCREYDELISIVVHMANQNSVFIGEERGLAIKLKPYILEQYPELKNIDQPKVNKETYAPWLKEQIAKYGETLPVSQLPKNALFNSDYIEDILTSRGTTLSDIEVIDMRQAAGF